MEDVYAALITGLQRATLFAKATPEAITDLSKASIQRNWAKGEIIFSAGDPSDGFYIVVKGQVRLSLTTEEGAELTIRDAGPSSVFGEMGALDSGNRSADARVQNSNVTTAFISSKNLLEILHAHPALLLDINRKLCARLRETTEQLEGIALYPLRQRLARFIQSRGIANGKEQQDGRRSISMLLSQGDLAMILGASRPKLNAALLDLERVGSIERRGSQIIYDPDAISYEARS